MLAENKNKREKLSPENSKTINKETLSINPPNIILSSH